MPRNRIPYLTKSHGETDEETTKSFAIAPSFLLIVREPLTSPLSVSHEQVKYFLASTHFTNRRRWDGRTRASAYEHAGGLHHVKRKKQKLEEKIGATTTRRTLRDRECGHYVKPASSRGVVRCYALCNTLFPLHRGTVAKNGDGGLPTWRSFAMRCSISRICISSHGILWLGVDGCEEVSSCAREQSRQLGEVRR